MQYKKVDEMSISDIKKEIIDARSKNQQFLSDLDSVINLVIGLKQKYGFIAGASNTIPTEKIKKKSQKDAITDVLKSEGELTTEQVILRLVKQGIIENNKKSTANIRSVFSRLVIAGIIKQDGNGKPWKLIAETEKKEA